MSIRWIEVVVAWYVAFVPLTDPKSLSKPRPNFVEVASDIRTYLPMNVNTGRWHWFNSVNLDGAECIIAHLSHSEVDLDLAFSNYFQGVISPTSCSIAAAELALTVAREPDV